MTTATVRPRYLTIAIVVLLVLQVAEVIQQLNQAATSMTRPPWVVAVHGGSTLGLLSAMLVGSRYPRVAWLLLAVSVACLVTSAFAVRQHAR
jgi:hypothetical protein